MSALLNSVSAAPTHLDRLTAASPSTEDLRYRARFWRKYVESTPIDELSTEQAYRIIANCLAMEDTAARMESPAPVVQLVKPVRKPRAAASKSSAMTAEQFWALANDAIQVMIRNFGLNWKVTAHSETFECTLPSKFRSYKTERGTVIRFRADQRFPKASFCAGVS